MMRPSLYFARAILKSMKPDQQSNYWRHDADGEKLPEAEVKTPVVTLEETHQVVSVGQGADNKALDLSEPVAWEATEYVQHDKNALWFSLFGLVVLGLIALAIFLIKSWTFVVLIAVMAVAVVVYALRPPRVLRYTLSTQGIHVGEKLYAFSDFKAFGIVRDGDAYFVMLVPNKRFMPAVSIYFPEESGEVIVDTLGSRLPMRDLHLDAIDTIVRKLRL